MSMKEWAENEIRIACKRENPDWDGKSFDYGCSCYQSALKAYKSICEDGHSGFSFGITRNILMRLINELPLTSINDTEDVWNKSIIDSQEDYVSYQCKRMSSLFKRVYKDGTVKYTDVNRDYCVDVDTGNSYRGFPSHLIDEMFPITMPYYPPVNKYKIYTKEFVAQGYFGDQTDFNTRAVLYCLTPEGEKIEINKYYADVEGNTCMQEITKEEYEKRLTVKLDLPF